MVVLEQEYGWLMLRREEKMGKKKRKGAAKVAAVLQSGSFPYHPEEEYIDKVSFLSFS